MNRARFTDKVALVTGAGRGQGRAHAVRLAREGADVVLCDIPGTRLPTVPYPMASADDLAETARLVEATGRRALVHEADVRDSAALDAAVARGVAELGRIDVLVANAGIAGITTIADMTDDEWDTMIAINLSGVFRSLRAVVGHMIERGSGRIVATSSIVGRQGSANIGHYVAAKWGVIGLVKSLALEVADHGITVNAVCPTSVDTMMIQNDAFRRLFVPDQERPEPAAVEQAYTALNPIPIPWLAPDDVSDAVLFLASDEARYITGEAFPVALGWNARNAS